jgi:hypothetical protein
VGRADTIWLRTAATGLNDRRAYETKVGALTARVGVNPVSHDKHVRFVSRAVELEATWGTHSSSIDQVLASAVEASGPPAPAPPASTRAPATPGGEVLPAPPRVAQGTVTSAIAAASTFNGMAFDTCSAPSASTMSAWLASPYRGVGIYIGGSMRACGDGNLSSGWVTQVRSMGWGLLPIYVGLQAPCVNQAGVGKIVASQAAAQGTSSAVDAVARAKLFGLAAGTPIYYDMEQYSSSAAGCSQAVLSFISAWTAELHRLGYKSGAYGSTSSLMLDMSRSMTSPGFVAPDNVWFANWNQLQTTSDSRSYPGFADVYWGNHQRVHQYAGNSTQSWGGVAVNVDANWVDGAVAGSPVPVNYGSNVVGPGSKGFIFTGSMAYWRPSAPAGVKGLAYWTYSNGSTEANGATWSPQLAPGRYSVEANIPSTNATAKASYTIRDALGTTAKVVNQQLISGYTSLGTYTVKAGGPISVHVGDNDATSTTTRIGVDAMAFRLVSAAPGAPTGVTATAGNAQAVVSWTAPTSNGGSAITGYTVTAAPGGRTATVSGATATTVTGLTNGTAYTFTVKTANALGTSPTSAASAAVTPRTVPRAPTGVTATAGNAQAVVSWTAPTSNGGAAITGYLVTAAPGGRTATVTGATATTVTGLTNGTAYTFTITASNPVGTGPISAMSNPVTPTPTVTQTRLSDFGGDGFTDLVARDTSGTLWLYPGDGSGGFLPRRELGSGWNTMTAIITPGDVTGDGDADVLGRDSLGRLWLYPGNGASALGARRQIGSGWNIMNAITNAANMNGVGHPALLARDTAGALWLYPISGNAVLETRTRIGTGWNGYTVRGPGDVSGDGRADILARDSAGWLWLYRGNGTGGVTARTRVSTGWQTMTALVTPGNWDRARGNDTLARDGAGTLWLYPGDNAGGLSARRQIGSGWSRMTYIG